MADREYTYYDFTLSLCPICLRRVDAKIVFWGDEVVMLKRCPEHGPQRVVIADDIDYYRRCRDFLKPGTLPRRFHTQTERGCPYDCGLCPDHEQHSCLTLVEITERCNLTCPTCYAESSPSAGRHRTLAEVEAMLDAVVASEGEPDVVQLSGGEPTIHPDFFAIVDAARRRPIRHLMVNTNGLRIAQDPGFAERLAEYAPGFEVYLQFDSLRAEPLLRLRGRDLRESRLRAIERLNEVGLSTTLVVTLQRGLNDGEIGELIDFARQQPCVRGITFQPTQIAGRVDGFDPSRDRLTMSAVRRAIIDQSGIFTGDDLIPVPCNPDALVMGYALRRGPELLPLTRFIRPADLLESGNSIAYEGDEGLRERLLRVFSTGTTVEGARSELHQLLCCLPTIDAPGLGYEDLFRVIIMRFIDAHDFDVRAIKRSCVHIVGDDLRLYPFETMNLFYRGAAQRERLVALRRSQEAR
ncbi:MAG: radical SAM protein [Myxococcales bacterium]|nr:radical SAM protein [Myxococcales bacterium]